MSEQNLPLIAIIGRPNVGKSSLFNRIVGRRIAIVHEQSGVTRDRIAAPVVHNGQHFLLVDTGGLGAFLDDRNPEQFDSLIRAQVEAVINEASRIIWVLDTRQGIAPLDTEIAKMLRETQRQVVTVANKADNPELDSVALAEFLPLGFGEPLPISCVQNRGIAELLEAALDGLNAPGESDLASNSGVKLAIIGRPNVGKSSLVNKLLGEDRVIVSDIPGTTRDAIDIPVEIVADGERVPVTLIDTAGLRRKRQVDNVVELFSVMRAENAIHRADIVILVLDATTPATSQDKRIARLVADANKPCIIAANKWDLACLDTKLRDLKGLIRHDMAFMNYAPVVGISALSGYNLNELVETLIYVHEQTSVTIPTALVNQFMQDTVARTPPPAVGAKPLKLFYATMLGNPPARFLLFVNQKNLCPTQYRQFIEGRLREAFFPEGGVPVVVSLRSRRSPEKDELGARRAIAGVMRQKAETKEAHKRHNDRRKGYRKKHR